MMTGPLSSDDTRAFLHRLHHDLRGPAQALRDLPNWLLQELVDKGVAMPPQAARHCRLMAENAARLETVLAGFTAWVQAHDWPRETPTAICPRHRLAGTGVLDGFEVSWDITVANVTLCDADFDQLFSIWASNVARFHPGPRPRVWIHASRFAQGTRFVLRDEGPGPSVQKAGALLAPLARADVGERQAGAGFGLAIASTIAVRYGGEIAFDKGATGRGADLRILLPDP